MKRRALVADDTRPLRSLIAIYVEVVGYNVTLVSNMPDALKEVSRDPEFDLVIANEEFGEELGVEVIEAVREAFPQASSITISARSEPHNPIGADRHLRNPFTFEEFCRAVREIESGRGFRAQEKAPLGRPV